jgi:hypothetical protein
MSHVSGILQTENRTNGKQQLSFVCCKQKAEKANFGLLAANKTENGSLFSLVGK